MQHQIYCQNTTEYGIIRGIRKILKAAQEQKTYMSHKRYILHLLLKQRKQTTEIKNTGWFSPKYQKKKKLGEG